MPVLKFLPSCVIVSGETLNYCNFDVKLINKNDHRIINAIIEFLVNKSYQLYKHKFNPLFPTNLKCNTKNRGHTNMIEHLSKNLRYLFAFKFASQNFIFLCWSVKFKTIQVPNKETTEKYVL